MCSQSFVLEVLFVCADLLGQTKLGCAAKYVVVLVPAATSCLVGVDAPDHAGVVLVDFKRTRTPPMVQ